jgi:hypothetical protein
MRMLAGWSLRDVREAKGTAAITSRILIVF